MSELIIKEDKYLTHLKIGDEFKLVLSDNFPTSWGDTSANNSNDIFISNEKIKFIERLDDNKLLFKVNKDLDPLEKISIKGLCNL